MDTINSFMFTPDYKVEILRDVWDFVIIITHLPTGLEREIEMSLTEDYILPLIRIMQDYITTHDMEEYKRMIQEVKGYVG